MSRFPISGQVAGRMLQLLPDNGELARTLAQQLARAVEPRLLWVEVGANGAEEAVELLTARLMQQPTRTIRRLENLAKRGMSGARKRRGRRAVSFIKWAGSKVQVMDRVRSAMPARFGTYFEPMVGSGTVWLTLNPEHAVLGDINGELVNCFVVIRDQLEPLLSALGSHPNTAEHFLAVRAEDPSTLTAVERAARTIYLNKTCFNGLYRVNLSGRFNVPYGHITWANTCDEETLWRVHARLQGVEVVHGDYEACLERAGEGDLVYFDPPYLSPGAKPTIFYAYQPTPFGQDEHRRLAELFRRLDQRGCHVVASNSDVPQIYELYSGFRIEVVTTTRLMNCKASRRKGWREVVISNNTPS